jgi:hypothetical protein
MIEGRDLSGTQKDTAFGSNVRSLRVRDQRMAKT